jgi:hypothetical protein
VPEAHRVSLGFVEDYTPCGSSFEDDHVLVEEGNGRAEARAV